MTKRSRVQRPSSPFSNSLLAAVFMGSALAGLALTAPSAEAQLQSTSRATQSSAPRAFLDCQVGRDCDFDHFRTEIDFVNWVRDRADADVHVIFTSTGLSDGGRQYSIDFLGLGNMTGRNDDLTYTSAGTDSGVETMDGLTQTLRLGLLRYAVESGAGAHLLIDYDGPALDGNGNGNGVDENGQIEGGFYDPWDYWTFSLGLSGNMDLQETETNSRMNPRVSANRVTADWKIELSSWANLRRERRELSDGTEVRNDENTWRVSTLVVRSVSDHISLGLDLEARNSISRNQRSRVNVAPAAEYNYFPYQEATRRQFIAHYAVGMERSDYHQETIYGVTGETVPQHRVAVQYRAREEWGNAGVGFDTSQYLHDASLYSMGFAGDLSYRVTRGLELNLSAEAAFANDNIYVPAEDIPDEDILLGRQSLPSSYRYQASLGFNYRWGSTFANVVNNRFPRAVR
jgi:hypothetical protein